MENVYVLVSNYVNVDSGDFSTEVIGVYSTFDKAHQRMLKEMNQARCDMAYVDLEEEEFVDGDMSWSIWEKENYPSLHCDLIIVEKEIIG